MTRDEMHIKALSKGVDSQKIKGSMTVVLLGHAVDMMMEMQDQHEAELKAKDEELGVAKKVAQDAYILGASQAAEMDRFWAEFGLLDENISVDDAIAFFKAKDERIEAQSSVIIACQNAILQKDERITELETERDKYNTIAANLQISRQKAYDNIAELEAIIEKMKSCEN